MADEARVESVGDFLWGMLAGAIVTVVAGGVILYFTWPFLARVFAGRELVEAAKELVGIR